MPKRKPKSPAPRRDPYTRALETAQKRLAVAFEQRTRYEAKLASLNDEIPKLQQIIGVLMHFGTPEFSVAQNNPINKQGIPTHLDRFLHPVAPVNIPFKIENEDDTLQDPLSDAGEELLP